MREGRLGKQKRQSAKQEDALQISGPGKRFTGELWYRDKGIAYINISNIYISKI